MNISVHEILVLAIDMVEKDGYFSKAEAAIKDRPPTSVILASSIAEGFRASPAQITAHGDKAQAIIDWIIDPNQSGSNDFIDNARRAIQKALQGEDIDKAYGYLAALPKSYNQSQAKKNELALVTKPNDFAGDAGTMFNGDVTLVAVRKYEEYTKVLFVSQSGHLIGAYHKPENKKAQGLVLNVGDMYNLTGRIGKLKFDGPCFETVISRSTIKALEVATNEGMV